MRANIVMKGLLLKEFYNLKKYCKSIFLIIVLYCILFIPTGGTSFLAGITVFLSVMLTLTSFSYDDAAKWDQLALSMPLQRRDIVKSKYLLLLISAGGGVVLSLLISLIASVFTQQLDMLTMFATIGATLLIAVLIFSIILPLVYKLGVEKMRFLMIGCILVPVILVTVGAAILQQMHVAMPSDEVMNKLFFVALCASPFILALALFFSYRAAVKIFNKKDI